MARSPAAPSSPLFSMPLQLPVPGSVCSATAAPALPAAACRKDEGKLDVRMCQVSRLGGDIRAENVSCPLKSTKSLVNMVSRAKIHCNFEFKLFKIRQQAKSKFIQNGQEVFSSDSIKQNMPVESGAVVDDRGNSVRTKSRPSDISHSVSL